MRVSAQFDDFEKALEAHKAVLSEAEVNPDNIEIRSSWPLFEEPLPPHLHRPMHIRNFVRFLWVCGAIGGFSLVSYCQLDYPLPTSGQALVPLPIDAIITYECAQITALIMTATFFFIETKMFRQRPIPHDEDLDVASGDIALVIDGPRAEAAKSVLEKGGLARIVRAYSSFIIGFLLILLLSGCVGPNDRPFTQTWATETNPPALGLVVRMRAQPSIKDTEVPHAPYAAGVYSMPTKVDPDLAQLPEPYGRLLTPEELTAYKKNVAYPRMNTPAAVNALPNPVPMNADNENRAKILYQQNCQFCHGVTGKGDGQVAPLYAPAPADLTRKDLVALTDGQLYWTLTLGPTVMPPFGNKMTAKDRYLIVHYMRKLQEAGAQAAPGGKK